MDTHREVKAEEGRPVDLSGLPDVEPGPDGGGEVWDPVMELSSLLHFNAEKMNALGQQGVQLNDSHPMLSTMVTNALLEEILRTVGGEGAVTRILLDTHRQIADTLAVAEKQVAQAKLMQGVPEHNGRVTRNGRLT